MKKLFTVLSFGTMLALSAVSYKSGSSLDLSKIAPEAEKSTYRITVAGDVKKNPYQARIEKNRVLNEIKYRLPADSYAITYDYDTLFNGFAIEVKNDAASEILKQITGVKSVELSHRYAAPEETSSFGTEDDGVSTKDASTSVYNQNKELKLKNYSAETRRVTKDILGSDAKRGKGIKIGIMDTGLYLNQVEGTSQRTSLEQNPPKDKNGMSLLNAAAFKDLSNDEVASDGWHNKEEVSARFKDKNGNVKAPDFTYINNKIPFAIDVADQDNNVDPTGGTEDNVHGTHVASLSAANGDEFQGIAPEAQVAIFKVFGNNTSGASDASVSKALEYAAQRKLDVVNLSLGSDLDEFRSSSSTSSTQNAIKACEEAGVIVNFAAGNAGKSTYAGDTGYSDWTTDDVETGILGSYALRDEKTNVIAASNPERAFFDSVMVVDGKAVSFSDQVTNRRGREDKDKYQTEHPLTELLGGEKQKELSYVRIGGFGDDTDYQAAADAGHSVKGKIAVVDRGSSTFREKVTFAVKNEAAALIVINNVPGVTFNRNMDFNGYKPEIPVVFVFQSTGSYFGDANTEGILKLAQNTVMESPAGGVYASFSSDGSDANLDISPTISAPGYQIIGAIQADKHGQTSEGTTIDTSYLYGYEYFDGTSMATPNLTGAFAVALSQHKEDADYATYKKNLSMVAMSTADSLHDSSAEKQNASIRIQGAGRINVKRILDSGNYVTTDLNLLDDGSAFGDAKAELANNGTLNTDLSKDKEAFIEIPYTIHNTSSTEQTYTPSINLQIPLLRTQVTKAQYDKEDSTGNTKDTPESLIDQITRSVLDDAVTVTDGAYQGSSKGQITVAANSTKSGTRKVRIDNLHYERTFTTDTSFKESFSGTLREYFAKYFKNAGGSYVEGFLSFKNSASTDDKNLDLNIPYLGFYGDYTKGAAVEPFSDEKEKNHVYTSELIDSRRKNLNGTYAKSKAYTGSTLALHGGKVTDSVINKIGSLDTAARKTINSEFQVPFADGNNLDTIYAGAAGYSDHIVATFFVNRTIADSSYTIKNASGATVSTGKIKRLRSYGGTFQAIDNEGKLYKSWLNESRNVNRGFIDIDLSSLAEGNYTLNFSFTPLATDIAQQTKDYKLVIDKSTATATGYKLVTTKRGTTQLALNTDADYVSAGGSTVTTDNGVAKFNVTNARETNDKIYAQLSNYAGNSTGFVAHPSDYSVSVISDDLKNDKYDFVYRQTNLDSNYIYFDVSLTGAKNEDINPTKDYTVLIHVGAGLSINDLEIYVDDAETKFTYDSVTGFVTLTRPKKGVSVSRNYCPVALDAAPKTATEANNSDTPSQDSSSQKPSTPSSAPSSAESGKKGCGGSVIVASSLTGALGLFAAGLAVRALGKKKKED